MSLAPDLGALHRGRRTPPSVKGGVFEDSDAEARIALLSPFAQERYRMYLRGQIDVQAELAQIPANEVFAQKTREGIARHKQKKLNKAPDLTRSPSSTALAGPDPLDTGVL